MTFRLAAFPPRSTKRLLLRPLVPGDAQALQRLASDAAATAGLPFFTQPFTLARACKLIALRKRGRELFFGAWRRADRRLVAAVGVHRHGVRAIEIGYLVDVTCRNRGYGGKAVAGVVAMVRAVKPGRRIVAECRPANIASLRLLASLGFRPSGRRGARSGRKLFALR